MFAKFSSTLPSEWASPNVEINVVDAVPFTADSVLDNADEVRDNIALISRGRDTSFVDKAKRAAEAGAVGVIIVDTDELQGTSDNENGYNPEIPVLVIKPSDVARMRELGSALIRATGTSL